MKKKTYVFRVTAEGITRTEKIKAESLVNAEEMMKQINPGCVIKFLWVEDYE